MWGMVGGGGGLLHFLLLYESPCGLSILKGNLWALLKGKGEYIKGGTAN